MVRSEIPGRISRRQGKANDREKEQAIRNVRSPGSYVFSPPPSAPTAIPVPTDAKKAMIQRGPCPLDPQSCVQKHTGTEGDDHHE